MILKVFTFIVLCFIPLSGYSAIYGYVDEHGVYHYTNILPVGKKFQVVMAERKMGIFAKNMGTSSITNSNYDTLIKHHSTMHGIDPSLVKAVMKAESNFNPYAISPKGAQGLMQLMPHTSKLMQVDDPFNPDENIKGGAKYLKLLDGIFDGNLELMLAAYNAGPNRVIEHNRKIPPIEETRTFINRVKQYYNKIKKPNEG